MGGSTHKIIATHEQVVHQSASDKCHRLGKFIFLLFRLNKEKLFVMIKLFFHDNLLDKHTEISIENYWCSVD
jgi:hypothetical protein